MSRRSIPNNISIQVLTEAGYRCAVPICRNILAIDIHHLVEVSEGGGNEPGNLLALCPMCHALFHRGEIVRDSNLRLEKYVCIAESRIRYFHH